MTTAAPPRPPEYTEDTQRVVYDSIQDAPYEPTPRQWEFHTATESIKLYGGAVGGGKTTCLVAEVLAIMWTYPHSEGMIGRKDFDDLRRTTYAEFLKWCPDELIYQHHKSEHWLRMVCPVHPGRDCGSLVHFIDTKDMGALKNANLNFVAFDQAEEINYEAFLWAGTRLRRKGLVGTQYEIDHWPILLSANPGPGWVKKLFIDKVRPQLDDSPEKPLPCCQGPVCTANRHKFVPALPAENPHLPPGYVDEQLENLPAIYAEMLIKGRWDVVLNAIYESLDRNVHLLPFPRGLQIIPNRGAIGVDFGESHFSAAVAVQVDVNNRKWTREVWAQRGGDVDEIVRNVRRLADKWHLYRGRTDPNQSVLAQTLSKSEDRRVQKYSFVRSPQANNSRAGRIGIMQGLLKVKDGPLLSITSAAQQRPQYGPWEPAKFAGTIIDANGDGCHELFDEAMQYKWDRTPAGRLNAPLRRDEDRVAAWEYAHEEIERPIYEPTPKVPIKILSSG